MKIAVWKTGHEIADTVAGALAEGFGAEVRSTITDFVASDNYDVNIAYGILRGTQNIFDNHWFNVDRGYTNPGHFDGNYRISYRRTQAKWHEGIPKGKWEGKLEPLKPYDASKPVLVCPPTEHVSNFFGITTELWTFQQVGKVYRTPSYFEQCSSQWVIREKGDPSPIDWNAYRAVITFNSSVGWEAVRRGIPCLSDVNHSLVGSFYGETDLNKLIQKFHEQPDRRQELFDIMQAHQFNLKEIREGKACDLLNHYLKPRNLNF